MGNIKKIIFQSSVPLFNNNRMVVELCENVHLHYRNIRLEFGVDEFLLLLEALSRVNPNEVREYKYGTDSFKNLVETELPLETEFNKRLQIEEQEEGHFHVHYRNLRLELDSLLEMGYGHFQVPLPVDENFMKTEMSSYKIRGMQTRDVRLGDLSVSVFTDVDHDAKEVVAEIFPIAESPVYAYLNGDEKIYEEYLVFLDKVRPGRSYCKERFNNLIESIKANGYRCPYIVTLNGENLIVDGHHRASILHKIFGEDITIKVLDFITG